MRVCGLRVENNTVEVLNLMGGAVVLTHLMIIIIAQGDKICDFDTKKTVQFTSGLVSTGSAPTTG